MTRRMVCVISFIILEMLSLNPVGAVGTRERGISVAALDKSSGEKKEVKLYNKSYAVIIGIDQYKNLKYDQQLSYAVRDAKGVEEVLRKNFKFDKIITLYNDNATKENIRKILLGDLSKLSKEDSVFVFWAGHGYTEKTDFGDLGYLLPFDGEFEKSKLYENISMSMIKDDISKRIPAKHIFFVMDACYGGLLVAKRGSERQTRRDFAYLREITKEQVRQVLTAGSKDQQVLDGGPKGHSVFTGRFIELLENTDDFITATEISSLVKEKVFSDAKARSHTQTPKYGELFGLGDYVFVPSLELRVEDTKGKVADLQKELARLIDLEKAATKAEDERSRRRAELEKKTIQAKLKAEQIRQQALEEDRRKREMDERRRFRREEELLEQKRAEEKRLAFLVNEVSNKRKEMGDITMSSLSAEATVIEMQEIDKKIKNIRADFRKELDDGIKRISTRFDKIFDQLGHVKKDEFETKREFDNRIEMEEDKIWTKQNNEIVSLTIKIKNTYQRQVASFIDFLKRLSRKEFVLASKSLVWKLNVYDAESKAFSVSINVKQPINGIMIKAEGSISIPPKEARIFKRYFEKNILRPEISGNFQGPDWFTIGRAYIVDDTTNKEYSLLEYVYQKDYVGIQNTSEYDL